MDTEITQAEIDRLFQTQDFALQALQMAARPWQVGRELRCEKCGYPTKRAVLKGNAEIRIMGIDDGLSYHGKFCGELVVCLRCRSTWYLTDPDDIKGG